MFSKESDSCHKLTADDREKLNELVEFLEQIWFAIDMLQSDGVSVSRIVPALNALQFQIDLEAKHELAMKKDLTFRKRKFHFTAMVAKLKDSIKIRLEDSYKNPLFTFAAILDPNYGLTWIEKDNG